MHSHSRLPLLAPAVSLLLPLATAAPAQQTEQPTTTVFYSSGNIAVPIPASGTEGWTNPVPLFVPDNGFVTDVNLRLRANHTFDSDLVITLVAPGNLRSVLLMNRNGGSGDNLGLAANDCSGTPTIFDDSAATTIQAGTPPYANAFTPIQALATLGGQSIHGIWQILIFDAAALDTGMLGCVNLQLTFVPSYPIFTDGFFSGTANAWSSRFP